MAERELPNLALTGFWDLGADNWKDANDLNLLKLSVLVQGGAVSKVSATPGAPTNGDVHIFDETHATAPNMVAIRDAGSWLYITPQPGWLLYNRDAEYYEKFDGTVWAELATGGGGGASAFADLTDVDMTTVAPTEGQVPVWDDAEGKWKPGDAGTSGGSGPTPYTTPVVRSSQLFSNDTSPVTVTWPSGTVAGDTVFIFDMGGFACSPPAGWDVCVPAPYSATNLRVFTKVMNAGDITAGGITYARGGSFRWYSVVVTIQGEIGGIEWRDRFSIESGDALGTGASWRTAKVSENALMLQAMATRGASAAPTSGGTLLQASGGSNGSFSVYAQEAVDDKGIVSTINFSNYGGQAGEVVRLVLAGV